MLQTVWHPDDIRSALRQPRSLAQREHRPWPLPDRPWIMGQTWEDLLFAHWRVDESALRRVVPAQIPIDSFDGSPWIGVTPFRVSGLRPRFALPLPGTARFPEINVRTYATIDGRPGIFFFSLDTPNRAAVATARRVYRLPYFRSQIEMTSEAERIGYRARRVDRSGPAASIELGYAPNGPVRAARPDSFEHWATERYCLYTLDEGGRVLRADIHHVPWALQPADATFEHNAMTEQIGIELGDDPLLHFARRQDVVFWLNEPA